MNETIYINQFEDTFYIHGKTIVINYLSLNVREYEGKREAICEIDTEAENKLQNFLKLYESVGNNKKAVFTLVPSYNCNMRCIYCFEGRQREIEVPVYNNINTFFKVLKKEYGYEQCEVILLGGEPVCQGNIQACEEYVKIIKEMFEIVEISCISNGLEIEKYYKKLKNMGVTKYQITLDGGEKTHNQRRPAYQSSINSFVAVCRSIDFLLQQKEDVEIRVNVDEKNLNEIELIIDLFIRNKWYKHIGENLRVYLYPISENGICTSLCYSNENEILRKVLLILKKMPKIKRLISVRVHGIDFIDALFHGIMPLPIIKFCGANSNQYVFAPDGYVYPCWWGHNEKNRIGRFSDNIYINKELIWNWRKRSIITINKCKNCKYQLLCGGGCTYKAMKYENKILCGNCADFYDIFKSYLEYFYDEKCAE